MAPKRKKTTAATNASATTTTTTTVPKKKKQERTLSDLKTLGNDLLSSKAHINNLPILLTYISPSSPPSHVVESLLSLQSFFSPLLPTLPSSKPSLSSANASAGGGVSDPDVIYRTWLRAKFDELVQLLIDIAVSPLSEEFLKEVVLDAIMEFVKLANGGKFHSALYNKLLQAIVFSSLEVELSLEVLASTYFKYADVQYFTFITVEKLCKNVNPNNSKGDKSVTERITSKASLENAARKIHFILSQIPPIGNLSDDIEMFSSGFLSKGNDGRENPKCKKADGEKRKGDKFTKEGLSVSKISKKMKLKFTNAWMAFLRLPLPVDLYKEVLVNLDHTVMPYLSNPRLLCDFLTISYDIGGVVSVMALSGLFVLMTKYELEYPNFYEKLYVLIVPSIFMAKHRSNFFELLDACLKSPLLPAYLAAAFAKKLSRLSLVVPPSGALVIIALVHNLLRRHPSINCLVHQEVCDSARDSVSSDGNAGILSDKAREKLGVDLFDDEESDPKKSNALRSSLWEIDTLRHHYCPAVSRFVLSLENDLTVRAKTTEVSVGDFSSASYSTISSEEMRRRVKQVPLAFYKATPTSLFSESDFSGWTFQCPEVEAL